MTERKTMYIDIYEDCRTGKFGVQVLIEPVDSEEEADRLAARFEDLAKGMKFQIVLDDQEGHGDDCDQS